MARTAWTLVAYFVISLTFKLVLCVIVLLPLPRRTRKAVLAVVGNILFFRVVRDISLIRVMMFLSGCILAAVIRPLSRESLNTHDRTAMLLSLIHI